VPVPCGIAIVASGARSAYAKSLSAVRRNVPKYVEKSETDLAWNRIRREVQYKINLAAAHWREQKQNELLPLVQAKFEEALAEGNLLELERADGEAEEWLQALTDEVGLA
jgi:hypothetical protein